MAASSNTHAAEPARFAGERWAMIVELIGPDTASVLDVGCRDRELRRWLPSSTRYVGLDIHEPADVVASVEDPLPFPDDAFECVVLADVLEHLEDPHGALDEALRVARRSVVVVLPNVYTLLLRLRYLSGETFGKYEFGPTSPVDRHRWIMNMAQAASFTSARASQAGWKVASSCAWDRPFRRFSARLGYALARAVGSENLWAWAYGARLEPACRDRVPPPRRAHDASEARA
jgi:SAM-dependent methyltransferase